jgi:hypothetical protein
MENSPSSPLRFVVHYHDGIARPHFDLMFELESGGKLATWRSPHWPPLPGDRLEKIADHRVDYLEYEGELSDDRGRVRRIVRGIYRRTELQGQWLVEFIDPEFLCVELPV